MANIATVWGTRIRTRRDALGLTTAQFAERLSDMGVPTHKTTVSAWERGVFAPNPERQVTIAAALETEWATLFNPTAAADELEHA